MAFGKKKSKDEEPGVEVEVEAEPEAGSELDGQLFASGETDAELEVDSGETPAVEEEEAAEPATIEPAADPLGGADLLSMFQTTTIEADDKAALLELAGEVEMDDLLEDLQTIGAALGIRS